MVLKTFCQIQQIPWPVSCLTPNLYLHSNFHPTYIYSISILCLSFSWWSLLHFTTLPLYKRMLGDYATAIAVLDAFITSLLTFLKNINLIIICPWVFGPTCTWLNSVTDPAFIDALHSFTTSNINVIVNLFYWEWICHWVKMWFSSVIKINGWNKDVLPKFDHCESGTTRCNV